MPELPLIMVRELNYEYSVRVHVREDPKAPNSSSTITNATELARAH